MPESAARSTSRRYRAGWLPRCRSVAVMAMKRCGNRSPMPPTGPPPCRRPPTRPCSTATWLLPSPPMTRNISLRRTLPLALLQAALALVGLWALPARAELQVNVTQGVTDPIPIAIVPFARGVPADGGLDIAGVVQHDLESSGRFRAMQRHDMLSTPTRAADVQAADWKAAGNDYVLVGRGTAADENELDIECDLVNTLTGQRIAGKRFIATGASLRNAAHMVSDFVYETVLGVRGAFATRVAYIAVQGQAPSQHF